jgi:hypothetical protein
MKKFWMGTVPEQDDFGQPIIDTFVDGKTVYGQWAFMAPFSYGKYGVGLGLGKGQQYIKQPDSRWMKVAG